MAEGKLAGALNEFGGHETHGDGLGWTCLYASVHTTTCYDGFFAGRPDALIELRLAGSASIIRRIRGQSIRRRTEPGLFVTVPPTTDFNIALEGQITALHVYVRKSVIDEVTSDFVRGNPSVVEIIPRFGAADHVVERLALAARAALDDPPHSARLYTDHLARALAARLLRDHSNVSALAFKNLNPRRGCVQRH
ncbi:hypothetical protein [Bradyrhizobium sp. USDA 10063]